MEGTGGTARVPRKAQTHSTGVMEEGLAAGEFQVLAKRGIYEETCRKFGYMVGKDKDGRTCQIAPYYRGTELVAQKLRYPDKTFSFIGKPKQVQLFGQQLWRDGGKMIVITEGEIDAMSVSQVQGNKYPVVSIPLGAQGARKSLAAELEWLERFDTVVLMFDQDEPGHKAAAECAPLFTPGKCKVARLPMKDANELLQAGRGGEIIDAIWGAREWRPDGIVSIGDLKERLKKPIKRGLSWPWPIIDEATYGIRTSELYTLGAGTGMGKSETFKEVMTHLVFAHGQKVGGLFLEESPEHTVRCLAGKVADRRFHVPDAGWTMDELDAAVEKLDGAKAISLFDHFGHTDYDTIKARIRFMAVSLGCRFIFLDHVTALVSGDRDGDERKQLDFIMTDLSSLIRELDVGLFLISHLATAEGTPHEEGGRVLLKHFRGSRAIGQWSNFVFGLEGNQQHEVPELRHARHLRILKDRYTGQGTGVVEHLKYEASTGRLQSWPEYDDFVQQHTEKPFKDETSSGANSDF